MGVPVQLGGVGAVGGFSRRVHDAAIRGLRSSVSPISSSILLRTRTRDRGRDRDRCRDRGGGRGSGRGRGGESAEAAAETEAEVEAEAEAQWQRQRQGCVKQELLVPEEDRKWRSSATKSVIETVDEGASESTVDCCTQELNQS